MPAETRSRDRKKVQARRRDAHPGTAWATVAVILSVIAAVLNLGSAALRMLPTSSSQRVVVVIRVSNGVAGFWPDKGAQHRSTMRTSERHPAKSESICPGR